MSVFIKTKVLWIQNTFCFSVGFVPISEQSLDVSKVHYLSPSISNLLNSASRALFSRVSSSGCRSDI